MSHQKNRTIIAIDLKSFYASVECVERGLDPLNTCLVVADQSRTNKTICLAVSPALKSFGVPGRPRLFEVEQITVKVNRKRAYDARIREAKKKSVFLDELTADPSTAVDYIVAVPRMQYYMDCSDRVYETYLKYVSADDIHVYSIDEVFMDVTDYLDTYQMSAHQLAVTMIRDVLKTTGVTATAGIGPNLYLAKVAMDIVAKHIPADDDGVRIAELDEISYRQKLWTHEPVTDFWRVGRGYAKRLAEYDLYTMGDIARFSLTDDAKLYQEFGINAELLIDHAWGYEPVTIADIKGYHTDNHSTGAGQVLMRPYSFEEAKTIVKEMVVSLALDLHAKRLVTDSISLFVNYDSSNDLSDYGGTVVTDYYGRNNVAKPASGTKKLKEYTSSVSVLRNAAEEIYDQKVNRFLKIRRINVTAGHVIPKEEGKKKQKVEVFDLFSDPEETEKKNEEAQKQLEKDMKLQDAMIQIQKKFGKNAVMTAVSAKKEATGKERNEQIGGHKK